MIEEKSCIGVVGAGRAGLSLAGALRALGREVLILSHHYDGPWDFTRWDFASGFLAHCGIVFIATRDADVSPTAMRLAGSGVALSGKVFLHLSGAQGPDALAPIREAGASCGVMHPAVSLPGPNPDALRGIYFGLAGDPEARTVAEEIVAGLGSRSFTIRDPALYHAACVMSAGFIAALVDMAGEIVGEATDSDFHLLVPLARSTLANMEDSSPARALTGPQVRGDLSMVENHLRALEEHYPRAAEIYRLLSDRMAEMVERMAEDL